MSTEKPSTAPVESVVIRREMYREGAVCCGRSPAIETIDTERKWQARYEYRVRCKTCGAMTTQCTWISDAKTLWNHGARVAI